MSTSTHHLRKLIGNKTQKEFAELFGIPLRTVQNWDSRRCMPDYIFAMVYMYYLADSERDKLKKKIRDIEMFGW